MRGYFTPRLKTTQELLHDTDAYKELKSAVAKKDKIISLIESAEEIREAFPRRFAMTKLITELNRELSRALDEVHEKNEAYEMMKEAFVSG